MNRRTIAAILAHAGLQPQHRFGQNFMIDETALAAIVEAGAVGPNDIVLEVGPGVGNLTELLAARVRHVLAVDIDRRLLPAAQRHHRGLTNVTWLQADALAGKHALNPAVLEALRELRRQHPEARLKLVSNLPYNAASPLVAELMVLSWQERLRDADPLMFDRLAFTVQWEVAARMAASPGTSDFGPLGILLQLMGEVAIVRKIPPGAFWPPPKINSGLVTVVPRREKIAVVRDAVALQTLLAGLFAHRRQTVGNALKHHLREHWTPALAERIRDAGIDLKLRPENLEPAQFLTLEELI